jgi:hypothetical protein
MTKIIQLNEEGYFSHVTTGDPSPLEPGVILLPGGCVETEEPEVIEGKRAKWNGQWTYEDIPQPEPESPLPELTYVEKRAIEYPPMADYLDGVVKGDQAQIDAYIAACLAVKAKYPKV